MNEKDKVIHAFPSSSLPDNLMEIVRNDNHLSFCKHEKISLNDHDRTVVGAKCKATLDPFDFLMTNAKTLHMAWYNYRIATQELSKLHERIEVLSKEEKNLKNRVKRQNEKSGNLLDVRGTQ